MVESTPVKFELLTLHVLTEPVKNKSTRFKYEKSLDFPPFEWRFMNSHQQHFKNNLTNWSYSPKQRNLANIFNNNFYIFVFFSFFRYWNVLATRLRNTSPFIIPAKHNWPLENTVLYHLTNSAHLGHETSKAFGHRHRLTIICFKAYISITV